MTKSEIFERLHRVEDLDAELRIVRMKIERLEGCLQGHAIRYDIDKVQTSPSDPVADIMARLDTLLDREKELQAEMAEAVSDVSGLIESLEDNKSRLVMHYRYVAGLRWPVIAEMVGCSERHVFRIHDKAINRLSKKS